MRTGALAWGERPDAFLAWMYCAAIEWADPPDRIQEA